MKSRNALCVVVVLVASAGSLAQLTPPPGPIQATDRVRINQQGIAAFPYVITQPGSYVLTSTIVVPGGLDAIVIEADDVAIDLNGFTIRGASGFGATSGVRTNAAHRGISVFNGGVVGWGGSGIDLWSSEQVRVVDVHAQGCGADGMFPTLYAGITVGAQATVERCASSFNSLNGIVAGDNAVIRGCTARSNGRSGIEAQNFAVVVDSACSNNGDRGFLVMSNARIEGCTADGNGYGFLGDGTGVRTHTFAVVKGCAARGNAGSGIMCTSRSLVADCTANQNGDCGIAAGYATTVQRCVANDNGTGGDARPAERGAECSVAGEAPRRNLTPEDDETGERGGNRGVFDNDGISVGDGSSVLDCVAQGNADDGVAAYFGSLVSRCAARFNGDADLSMDYGEGSILDCTSEYSYGYGIRAGQKTKVARCTVNRATADGISAADECEIVGNTATQCGFAGISTYGQRTRVHDNLVLSNQTGIGTLMSFCVVTGNRASANAMNYSLAFGTVQGQMVNMTGGGTIFVNDPWMNLEY